MKLSHLASALLASSMLFTAVSANAADPITITGSTALTTDYLFRGISQTGNNAAIQGSLAFTHESGAYFSLWGSSIGFTEGGLELDALLGYSGKAGEVGYDVGVMHYGYPSADGALGYDEIYASVSTMGLKVGLNYSPDYFAATDKFVYLYAGYSKEVSGVTLSGSVGVNKFDSAAMLSSFLVAPVTDDSYMDYKLAASKSFSGLTLEGAYIGSDIDEKDCAGGLCEGRFVVTLTKGF
ncbi:MAG: TorF family putative porin [Agitococcus sp.]|nr:TorF family putative porin [Agitococcus sp.]MDO9178879.1 TorF family putative porin [Agitococcus sp.]